MQNCQSLIVVQLCHLCLANLTKCRTDLLHDVEDRLALLVQLKLELLGKTEQGNTPRQDALIIPRVQGIGDVIGQGWPALRIVNPTDHDNAPDVLLRDQAVRHLVHLRDNVRSNVLLVRVREHNVAEAGHGYLFRLLLGKELPVVVDALTELNGGSQTQILVDGRVSGHFKHRGAVVGALLRLNEELLGLLAERRVGAKRCSQRLLQIVQEISVHSHFCSSADGVLTFSAIEKY